MLSRAVPFLSKYVNMDKYGACLESIRVESHLARHNSPELGGLKCERVLVSHCAGWDSTASALLLLLGAAWSLIVSTFGLLSSVLCCSPPNIPALLPGAAGPALLAAGTSWPRGEGGITTLMSHRTQTDEVATPFVCGDPHRHICCCLRH